MFKSLGWLLSKFCYAERVFPRVYGPLREFTDIAWHPERLDQPLHWRKPCLIFVNSMSDLFHEAVPEEFLDRVFHVMIEAKQHTFQVLTKRPERMRDYMMERVKNAHGLAGSWPPPNVWLGVSCEDQPTADERIPILLETPAAVRFISAEPLLEAIQLSQEYIDYLVGWMTEATHGRHNAETGECLDCPVPVQVPTYRLDWVIVGGESGPKARLCSMSWIESIIQQCKTAGIPVFVKQLGADPRWTNTDLHPIVHTHGKCDDPNEWPPELRVREFPHA